MSSSGDYLLWVDNSLFHVLLGTGTQGWVGATATNVHEIF